MIVIAEWLIYGLALLLFAGGSVLTIDAVVRLLRGEIFRQTSAPQRNTRARVMPYSLKTSAARALDTSFGQVQKSTMSRSS